MVKAKAAGVCKRAAVVDAVPSWRCTVADAAVLVVDTRGLLERSWGSQTMMVVVPVSGVQPSLPRVVWPL